MISAFTQVLLLFSSDYKYGTIPNVNLQFVFVRRNFNQRIAYLGDGGVCSGDGGRIVYLRGWVRIFRESYILGNGGVYLGIVYLG